jgi:ferredoxin
MPKINYKTSGCEVEFPDGEDVNLLRVAIRNDCGVPWRCASGNCGTDRVRVVEGAEHFDKPRKRERDRLGDLIDAGFRLACQSYVSGDCTVEWDPDQKGFDIDDKAAERLRRVWLGKADSA